MPESKSHLMPHERQVYILVCCAITHEAGPAPMDTVHTMTEQFACWGIQVNVNPWGWRERADDRS